ADICLHLHAVAKKAVDVLVIAVQAASVVVRLCMQCGDGSVDLVGSVAASNKERSQHVFFDIAVAIAVAPVAEISVAKLIAEEPNDAILGGAFGFADVA